jgi:hypothetical protein
MRSRVFARPNSSLAKIFSVPVARTGDDARTRVVHVRTRVARHDEFHYA